MQTAEPSNKLVVLTFNFSTAIFQQLEFDYKWTEKKRISFNSVWRPQNALSIHSLNQFHLVKHPTSTVKCAVTFCWPEELESHKNFFWARVMRQQIRFEKDRAWAKSNSDNNPLDRRNLDDNQLYDIAVMGGLYDSIADPYDSEKNGDNYSSLKPDLVKYARKILAQVGIHRQLKIYEQVGLDKRLLEIANDFPPVPIAALKRSVQLNQLTNWILRYGRAVANEKIIVDGHILEFLHFTVLLERDTYQEYISENSPSESYDAFSMFNLRETRADDLKLVSDYVQEWLTRRTESIDTSNITAAQVKDEGTSNA